MDEYIKRDDMRAVLEKASISPRFADEPSAADVEPVVYAHWIPKPQMVRSPYARNYSCSHCGHEPLEAIDRCPKCGAHMDGEA